jgi:hypothetical protein
MKVVKIANNTLENDQIIYYKNENHFLASMRKSDWDLAKNKLSKQIYGPGIYILANFQTNFRYVGQSTNIEERISRHILDGKKQFNYILFFGLESGNLNRSQLDYLEKYFINEVPNTDNHTVGNTSTLEYDQEIEAENLKNDVLELLINFSTLDVFNTVEDDDSSEGDATTPSTFSKTFKVTDGKLTGTSQKSITQAYFDYIINLYHSRKNEQPLVYKGNASTVHLLATDPPTAKVNFSEIEKDVYLYRNLSSRETKKKVTQFAKDKFGLTLQEIQR